MDKYLLLLECDDNEPVEGGDGVCCCLCLSDCLCFEVLALLVKVRQEQVALVS